MAYMFSTSFKTDKDAIKLPPELIPSHPTLENYYWLFTQRLFLRYYANTLIVTLSSTLFSVILSCLAGYGISRIRFRGRNFFSLYLFISQMLPSILILIPLFYILRLFNLVNTYIGLICAYITFSLPFCSWMLKGYFDTIPPDLEESAMVDGCGRVGAFYRIVLPLSAPGLASVTIWSFLLAWQEYLFAMAIMMDEEMKTLTAGMSTLVYVEYMSWGKLMAYCTAFTVPVFILFIFIQRYLVAGLTLGAVKR
jgi:ABC-type glycerol-3-phosphate transport system permease component